jgi:hypothetical protein
MESHIYLKNHSKGSFHFIYPNQYDKFIGCHFEENKNIEENNFIHKAIIKSIYFKPDSIYLETDGNAGTCWCAQIIDNFLINYYFRNFENLVENYKKKGYIFIN